MNSIVHNIELDLFEQTSRVYVSVQTKDSLQKVSIGLRAGGRPYDLDSISQAVLDMKVKSGSTHINQAGTVNGNRIEVTIPTTVTNVIGEFDCVLALVGSDGTGGTYLHTPPFTIIVNDHSSSM